MRVVTPEARGSMPGSWEKINGPFSSLSKAEYTLEIIDDLPAGDPWRLYEAHSIKREQDGWWIVGWLGARS
jgi:hypothetical protein